MSVKQIEQVIELLKASQTEQAIKELTSWKQEAVLKQKDKKSAKLFNIVQAYLKVQENKRPLLSKLQPTTDGKKFIISNYTAIKFFKEFEALESFETVDPDRAMGDSLFEKSYNFETIPDDELLILNNLKKFTRLYKNNHNKMTIVYLFNRFFDCKLLLQVLKFFDTTKYSRMLSNNSMTKSEISPLQLLIQDNNCADLIQGIVLPIRIKETEEQEYLKEYTNDFLKMLKGELKWNSLF